MTPRDRLRLNGSCNGVVKVSLHERLHSEQARRRRKACMESDAGMSSFFNVSQRRGHSPSPERMRRTASPHLGSNVRSSMKTYRSIRNDRHSYSRMTIALPAVSLAPCCHFTTVTGTSAKCATLAATEPSTRDRTGPWLLAPMMIASQPRR